MADCHPVERDSHNPVVKWRSEKTVKNPRHLTGLSSLLHLTPVDWAGTLTVAEQGARESPFVRSSRWQYLRPIRTNSSVLSSAFVPPAGLQLFKHFPEVRNP